MHETIEIDAVFTVAKDKYLQRYDDSVCLHDMIVLEEIDVLVCSM